MNIFVTDRDPVKSAQCLPDKHVVKMPLESCQMLAIVASKEWGHGFGKLPKIDGTSYLTEKGAFRNHPCTIWAQENYRWLIEHGLALCYEYTHRYGKIHSCQHTLEHVHKYFHSRVERLHLSRELCPMSTNMTQALTLLLLINVISHPNLGLHLIIFVTHPANRIGYE